MPSADFDAARRERQKGYDPVTFTLGGATFRCKRTIGFEVLLRRITDEEAATPATIFRFECGFVADCLDGATARKRWEQVLVNPDEPIEEADVLAVVKYLVGVYAARPTSPSSGSSGGRKRTGGRSSSTPSRRSPGNPKAA